MLQPLVRRTWAKRGKPPILKAWDRHDRLTAITALVYEPHRRKSLSMYFQLQPRNAKAETFLWFLVALHRQLHNHMVVIWDRLGAHRKAHHALTQLGCEWLSFDYLPAYCPKLNPVEHVWATTKYGRLANWPAPDIDQLNCRLDSELRSQQTETQLLRSHFAWAKLSLSEDTLPAQ